MSAELELFDNLRQRFPSIVELKFTTQSYSPHIIPVGRQLVLVLECGCRWEFWDPDKNPSLDDYRREIIATLSEDQEEFCLCTHSYH